MTDEGLVGPCSNVATAGTEPTGTGDQVTDRHDRFRRLYDDNHAAILGYALRRTDSSADAHDVVGDTFLVAWRRLDDVPDGDRARLWLYGTARRTLANHHRGRRRHRGLVDRVQVDAPQAWVDPDPADDTSARVGAAFGRLAPADRDVLLLVGWEQLDAAGIAEVLGCTAATARVRLHRARRRFARQLEHEGLQQDGSPGHVKGRRATARPDTEAAR